MRVLICDYASRYRFPANGYGSIERWLATAAKYIHLLGNQVILSGPLWDADLIPGATWWPERLSQSNVQQFLAVHGRVDLLLAGHEAFDSLEWEEPYLAVAQRAVSYQHGHELYSRHAYDGSRRRLFCFSDEMMARFADQVPRKLGCYSEGIGEEPQFLSPRGYLVWIGRLDEEKAVDYAIEAAKRLGRRLLVMGEPRNCDRYYRRILGQADLDHVTWLGTCTGMTKMRIIAEADAMVYTCSREWIEAAAAVLWETLLSGVPIAGMSWRGAEAVIEAVGTVGGAIASIDPRAPRTLNMERLAEAIEKAVVCDRNEIRDYARQKFDPFRHVEGLIAD